jgi:hypothetical protein
MLGVVVVAVTAVRDEVGFEAPARVRQPWTTTAGRVSTSYPGGTGAAEDSINGHEPYL